MKKKILHIAAHLGGGVGKATSGLAIGLKDYFENEVVILEEPESKRYVDLCKEHNVDVNVVYDVKILKEKIIAADYVIFSWWGHPLSYKIYKILSEGEARIFIWVHVNGWHYPYISPEFLEVFDGMLFSTTCIYENDKWMLEQQKRIKDASEIVYGSGLFYPDEIKTKENYQRNDKVIIGYTGTINYNKMSFEFPKICSEVRKRVPNVEFRLFGVCDEDTYNSFIEYDSSLKDCMYFMGYVSDVDRQLLDLDIFCYPLNKENFGTTDNTLVEAMAAGVPIVVFDNPAEKSVIDHNKSGLIANTTEQFIQHIVNLCEDANLAKTLGQNARAVSVEKFDNHVNADLCNAYIKKYEQVEKTVHDFQAVVGKTPGETYLYFANMTKEDYIEKAKNNDLHPIFKGESKSSVYHYLRYYSDPILEELKLAQGE